MHQLLYIKMCLKLLVLFCIKDDGHFFDFLVTGILAPVLMNNFPMQVRIALDQKIFLSTLLDKTQYSYHLNIQMLTDKSLQAK